MYFSKVTGHISIPSELTWGPGGQGGSHTRGKHLCFGTENVFSHPAWRSFDGSLSPKKRRVVDACRAFCVRVRCGQVGGRWEQLLIKSTVEAVKVICQTRVMLRVGG